MSTFWEIVASNAVVAAILAVVALVLGRVWKNAAAVHVVWLVVLLKLFTPPVFTARLPMAGVGPSAVVARSEPKEAPPTAPRGARARISVVAAKPRNAIVEGADPAVARSSVGFGWERWPLPAILGAIWLGGSIGLLAISLVRIGRFARGLRDLEAAPPAIRAMISQLSGRLGLSRDPDVLMTDRVLPPLVWSLGIHPRVILPERLFDGLGREAQCTILAHELVHIRRRDHLVRLLELAATTVFWWHPVVWLATWQLRELEEQCCDGRVLELLPDRPRTYAGALVDTLEFLSGGACRPTPLRTAILSTHSISRRISMLTQRRVNRLSALSGLFLIGLTSLPMAVAFGVGPMETARPVPEAQQPAVAPVAVIRGRVTSKADAPLPGVRVRVAIPAADMRFIDANTEATVLETRSDALGNYRLELPGISGKTKVSIEATMPGFRRLSGTLMMGGDVRNVEVEPGREVVEAVLKLEPARYFGGMVVDEQGGPIAGVEIGAYFVFDQDQGMGGVEQTVSRSDGTFDLFNFADEKHAFDKAPGKGSIIFAHPNYVMTRVEDVDSIAADGRGRMRVVLPTGRRLTGTVLDEAGKPVRNTMVEADFADWSKRKAIQTDATGKFDLRGLDDGSMTLTATALEIKQKARLPMKLDGDKVGLEVRLRPIALPADLKKYEVLGMQLADMTPTLKSAYDLFFDQGAVILDPGRDSARLEIGQLAEGFSFWMVGQTRVKDVREFVDQLINETGGLDLPEHLIRVVYSYRTAESVGTNTQYMKLTRDDVKQLQAISDRLKAEAK